MRCHNQLCHLAKEITAEVCFQFAKRVAIFLSYFISIFLRFISRFVCLFVLSFKTINDERENSRQCCMYEYSETNLQNFDSQFSLSIFCTKWVFHRKYHCKLSRRIFDTASKHTASSYSALYSTLWIVMKYA